MLDKKLNSQANKQVPIKALPLNWQSRNLGKWGNVMQTKRKTKNPTHYEISSGHQNYREFTWLAPRGRKACFQCGSWCASYREGYSMGGPWSAPFIEKVTPWVDHGMCRLERVTLRVVHDLLQVTLRVSLPYLTLWFESKAGERKMWCSNW